ncbi:MAG: beta-lactamase family protein, partial [Oscillospiraceae bacterium]|nr:beta-lactamase family protein [Oscillospiraceae bacterium]
MHGMDTNKLKRNLDALLSKRVADGLLPCAQAAVFRRGETVYTGAFGWLNQEQGQPLPEDAIFRIYSMSKVFTSVAALTLLEEGRYKLNDPLYRYFPEFEQSMVAEVQPNGQVNYVAPRRPIWIRDLFTMATGIPYENENGSPAERAVAAWERMKVPDSAAFMAHLATIPLDFHPGEHWRYGLSIDMLGALVERLSGQKLGAYMKARIFDPLGMEDTDFVIPPEKLHRFVTMYEGAPGAFVPVMPGQDLYDEHLSRPGMEGGGGGLTSTLKDTGRFIQMLQNLGTLDGVRILSRRTVELMRTNFLSPQQLIDDAWDTQRGYGYGLGVRTMMHPEIAGFGNV